MGKGIIDRRRFDGEFIVVWRFIDFSEFEIVVIFIIFEDVSLW